MYDAIVVGSGATGAWTALLLAQAGRRVLVLEGGPRPTPAAMDRLRRHRDPEGPPPVQPVQSRLPGHSPPIAPFLVDDVLHPYAAPGPAPYTWLRSRQLGGRTVLWGGVAPRLADEDFAATSTGAAWPFTAADIAPHYDRVEAALGVDRDQPLTAAEHALAGALEARWPGVRVRSRPGIPRRPERADADGAVWPATASPVLLLDRAVSAGAEVRTDCIVESLALDGERVGGVNVVDRRTRERGVVRAGAVALCASTIESTRILLHSRNREHPHGVGNSSGHLGRHLRDHLAVTVSGTAAGFTGPDEELPLGGPFGIYAALPQRRFQVEGWAQRGAPRPGLPARFSLAASAEMTAGSSGVVTLDDELRDAWGIPAPAIRLTVSDEDAARVRRAEAEVLEACASAGFDVADIDRHHEVLRAYVHDVGTARMGADPAASVADPHNRVWDAPNVLVLDGACWPANPCPNPTLTMLAIASRACDACTG
ncbi:MAG: GMC oxidoreductase [Actinomycetota bacterium]